HPARRSRVARVNRGAPHIDDVEARSGTLHCLGRRRVGESAVSLSREHDDVLGIDVADDVGDMACDAALDGLDDVKDPERHRAEASAATTPVTNSPWRSGGKRCTKASSA